MNRISPPDRSRKHHLFQIGFQAVDRSATTRLGGIDISRGDFVGPICDVPGFLAELLEEVRVPLGGGDDMTKRVGVPKNTLGLCRRGQRSLSFDGGETVDDREGEESLSIRFGFTRQRRERRQSGAGHHERELVLADPVEPDDETTRLNDVKTDRAGRLWGGTMAFDARADAGAFYRIDPDGAVTTVARPITISNGMEWSPDGSLMYYIDTATGRMDVFDFDLAAGSALNRRPFIHFDESLGNPDGMTIDAEGCLWVAFYDGWAVRRFSPAGELERSIAVPAARATSCAFGGPDLDLLYVTSARDGLSESQLAEQPHAGGLFVIEPGVKGSPITPFAG